MFARAAASVAIAGALLLGTSGCSFFATQATLIHYEPSDGTAATIDGIGARNVIAVSADGKTASLIMSVINNTDTGQLVDFQWADATGAKQDDSVYVGANSTSTVGYTDSKKVFTMSNLDVTVGGLIPVYMQYGSTAGKQLMVPVLDGQQPQFTTLVPITPAS